MAVEYIETRDVSLSELQRFPGNAKHGDVAKIRESIRKTGQYRSIVVRHDETNLVILAGNHTFDAVKAENYETIRCELIRCTESEARRINLADNRLAEIGSMDTDALVELLSYLDDDYEGTGYDAAFVEELLNPSSETTALTEPDVLSELPPTPRSKSGDLWLLGPHRLLCGDSTNPEHLNMVTDGLQPTIVYTDPPYGISIVSGGTVGGSGPVGGVKRGKVGGGKIVPASNYIPVAGEGTTDTAADAFRLLITIYPTARHVWWGGNHYTGSANLPPVLYASFGTCGTV
ncbi:MAG: ParB N-terminal domain-containing protein [Candidatus Dormibacteria bacterium]